MKVLVTGGAGFIGSTVASALLDAGHEPVILDSLVTGRREFVAGRTWYEGDVADGELVRRVFREHPDIAAAIHCAALIVVPDSVADPVRYYEANVVATLRFVESLLAAGCHRLVFSSSASIYGPSADLSVDEDSPIAPQSPYARTKSVVEDLLRDVAAATPLRVVSLRYFNPIGSDPRLRTGNQLPEPTHALGNLMRRVRDGEVFPVYGAAYPTRDGTGLRDYVHVWDLAEAHLATLTAFERALDGSTSTAVNLGTGRGTTVLELVHAFERVTGASVRHEVVAPRPGDPAGAYTRVERAARVLGWSARRSLDEGIADALRWFEHRASVLPDLA